MYLRTARVWSTIVVAVIGAALAATPARAQEAGSIDLNVFRPAMKAAGSLVEYLGELDQHDRDDLFAQSYATLMPGSWPEPFGLVLIESLAAGTPVIVTDRPTAELVKVAANAFLATKISFINAMADVADASGADVTVLADAIGYDDRIGRKFLNAGIGFGDLADIQNGELPEGLDEQALQDLGAEIESLGGDEIEEASDAIEEHASSECDVDLSGS